MPARPRASLPSRLPAWRSLHLNANYLKRMALLPRLPLLSSRPPSVTEASPRRPQVNRPPAPLFTPFSRPTHAAPTCLGYSPGRWPSLPGSTNSLASGVNSTLTRDSWSPASAYALSMPVGSYIVHCSNGVASNLIPASATTARYLASHSVVLLCKPLSATVTAPESNSHTWDVTCRIMTSNKLS